MKKALLLLATAAFITSCNRLAENEYEISGTIDPSLNGKKIILEKTGGYMGFIPVDTAVVTDGKFEFKGTTTQPELRFLTIDEPSKKIDFILEHGSIEIAIDKDSLLKTVRTGTHNNEVLQDYTNSMAKVRQKGIAWQKKNEAAITEAYQKNDTVTLNKFNKQYAEMSKAMQQQAFDFVTKNPDRYVAVLLIKQMASSGRVPIEDVKKYYNGLTAEMKKTNEGKEIAESIKLAESPTAVGKPAPEFSATSPDGNKISLKQAMGKATIIDFWASWCGPCRKENPNVVALYNDFHGKGLNIIGVSLDKHGDAEKWKQAIAADRLAWTHVSNLMHWDDPIAKQYGVKGIPATFLLDANGTIVARDLRGAELRAAVNNLLK